MRALLDEARHALARLTWPSWRTVAIGGTVVVGLGLVVAAAVLWFAAEQRRGLEAFADAMVKVRLSQAPGATPEAQQQAVQSLEAVLGQKASGAISAQVTYELGNIKYSIQQYPESRSAYELTASAASPTLRRLAQASMAYTWEVEKNYPKAIAAYEAALSALKPGEFLYDDLLMNLGRVLELAERKDDAVKTYQRVVGNPKSLRSDDARARLASLGIQQSTQ